ncbi:MAG: hypothetical protein HQL40_03560 [Alphaproteobacteria bacterium]|nr:hypothetical protein [Alphaproteobacteria bacterium]MBF0332710.1 hypothetical protein [Alphaproteobacteria bacterium]MBF0372923.1 hypothetical protein [Alphaproteobacteria bacterium]
MSTIDLDNPPPNHRYKVSVDPYETDGERRVRLAKDMIVFLVAVGFVVVIFFLCYETVASASAGPDEKKWAMSIMSAGMAGLVGYLVRK